MTDSTIQQKLTAEVIGTFVLVLFGCGSVVIYGTAQSASQGGVLPSTLTTIGLTFGIAVMVMAYAFGRVSGAHFNPAVSVGAAMSGRMSWRDVGLYVVAQLVGAVLGALALFVLMQGFPTFDAENNMGQNSYGDLSPGDYAWWAAFLLELVLTAVFVTVILAVTDERNEHPSLAPLTIGFTLAAIHFVAIPATGTSVNPARSIGPALFAGTDAIAQLWLFILAPLLGAAVAGLAYPLVFGRAGEVVIGSGITFSRPRTAAQVPGLRRARPVPAGVEPGLRLAASTGYAEPQPRPSRSSRTAGSGTRTASSGTRSARPRRSGRPSRPPSPPRSRSPSAEPTAWPDAEPGDGGTQIRPPS